MTISPEQFAIALDPKSAAKRPPVPPRTTTVKEHVRRVSDRRSTPAGAAPGKTNAPPPRSSYTDASGIPGFVERYFERYNAGTTKRAAEAYVEHINAGGAMWLSIAGAMSTAGLGKCVAELIRREKVHAIVCTGANLEEDLFLLCGRPYYEDLSDYRDLTPKDDQDLRDEGKNRVTDTAFDDQKVIEPVVTAVEALWKKADKDGTSKFPHEYLYEVIRSGVLKKSYKGDPNDSWLLAAAEANLPIFVPGWEDSTLGNACVAAEERGDISTTDIVLSGLKGFQYFARWYADTSKPTKGKRRPMGMFQIGGGIAGDAPICAIPFLRLELKREDVPLLAYFAQVTDATESYGGYSGAPPTEKLSWGKLDLKTKYFDIHSDATIVAPIIFEYVLAASK